MKTAHRIATAVAVALTTAGCTSMQPVDHRATPLQETLKPGQRVVIYDNRGRVLDLRYVLVADGELRGSLSDDGFTAVAVPLADIERLEAEKIAVGLTAGAVAGGIVLLPVVVVATGLALAEEMH